MRDLTVSDFYDLDALAQVQREVPTFVCAIHRI